MYLLTYLALLIFLWRAYWEITLIVFLVSRLKEAQRYYPISTLLFVVFLLTARSCGF